MKDFTVKVLLILSIIIIPLVGTGVDKVSACLWIDPYGHGEACYTIDPRNYSLPGDPGYWSGTNTKPKPSDSYVDYGDVEVREPQFPGEPCIYVEKGPPRTSTSYWGGCGGGGGSDDGGYREPPTPPKPSFIPPTVPTVSDPNPGDYPSWVTNPSTTIVELPKDGEVIRDKESIYDIHATRAEIRYSNIPVNGLITLSNDSELKPELIFRHGSDTFNIPFQIGMDSVTKAETTKLWKKFTDGGNAIDLFIFKYDNPEELPQSVSEFFTMDKNKFQFYTTVTDSSTDLRDFKINKSGTYILGTRVDYKGLAQFEVLPIKVDKFDSYGWLPVSNNVVSQFNDKLINNGWKQSKHQITDLTDETYKSLKASSSYNHKHKVTAIGSPKGAFQLKLIKEDNTPYPNSINLNANLKITEILEYEEGFLVSTNGDGVYYLNLLEGKSMKLTGTSFNEVNDIFVERGNLYVATNKGLSTGTIDLTVTEGTDTVIEIKYTESKFLDNKDIFNPVSEIDSIEVILGKIILTPKLTSSSVGVSIIDKM